MVEELRNNNAEVASRLGKRGIPEHPISKTYEHGTPEPLFNFLNDQWDFTLDPCASKIGPKLCPVNYTIDDDGLSQDWTGSVFMNPPYGDLIPAWVAKANKSAWSTAEVVVGLLPARTDTRWFHEHCMGTTIYFVERRIKFVGSLNRAPFPSMVVIWGARAKPWKIASLKLPSGCS